MAELVYFAMRKVENQDRVLSKIQWNIITKPKLNNILKSIDYQLLTKSCIDCLIDPPANFARTFCVFATHLNFWHCRKFNDFMSSEGNPLTPASRCSQPLNPWNPRKSTKEIPPLKLHISRHCVCAAKVFMLKLTFALFPQQMELALIFDINRKGRNILFKAKVSVALIICQLCAICF